MDVGSVRAHAGAWFLLAFGCLLLPVVPAQAAPLYTVIDLGAGDVTLGDGTVTGSDGRAYTFNPAPNDLPSAWRNTSQGVPNVVSVPVSPTYPVHPTFSNSTLSAMNREGLAAGIDLHTDIIGHWINGKAFITQQQPDGTWGPPVPLWSGTSFQAGSGQDIGVGILGVSSSGQVVGYGNPDLLGNLADLHLYAYDSKSQTLTDLTNLIQSTKWTSNPPSDVSPYWWAHDVTAQVDAQGRILTQAVQGWTGARHGLLLVPQGAPDGEVAAPEPSTSILFAILIGGLLVRRRRIAQGTFIGGNRNRAGGHSFDSLARDLLDGLREAVQRPDDPFGLGQEPLGGLPCEGNDGTRIVPRGWRRFGPGPWLR